MRPTIPEGGFKSADEQIAYFMERQKTDQITLPILGFIKSSAEYFNAATYQNGHEGIYVITDDEDTPCGIVSLQGTCGRDNTNVNYQILNLSPSVINVMARDAAIKEVKGILEEVIEEEIRTLKEYIDSSARDLIGKLEDGAGSNGVTEKTLIEIVKTISKNA